MRRHRAILPCLCCLVAGLAGCREEASEPAPPLPVVVRVVAPTDHAPEFVLTGVIAARVQSDLSFRITGQISERTVDVGARVDAGDVLARLDSKIEEAEVAGAAAAVEAATARLRQVTSIFERQKVLLAQGFTTRRDFDQAEQTLRSAEAMVDGARTQLATARDQLAQTVLRAPAAGIVTARHVEVGRVVQPSLPVFGLAEDGPRDAVVDVQEALLAAGPARRAEISLVSDPKVRASGEIREVAPVVDPSGSVRVKIGIPETPAAMVLGSAVRVTEHTRRRSMIVLPWSALYSDDGRPAVWVADVARGTVSLRAITIAAYRNSDIVVEDGLRAGETVVTSGTHLLRPAQKVAMTEEKS
jgi:RND family efflux transporter MFP subunit